MKTVCSFLRPLHRFALILGLVLTSTASATISVSALPSASLTAPAQPHLSVHIVPNTSYDANGNSDTDWIYYEYIQAVGYATSSYSTWSASSPINIDFLDPRGNLGGGSYTYVVSTVGYAKIPYQNWVDGQWVDEHDNPDNPDDVTGQHWEDSHWDTGINWSWQTIESSTVTVTITSGAAQTVTFTNPGTHNLNDTFTLSASASSGLPVTFSIVAGGGTLTGSSFTATTVGSVTLRATQAGQNGAWQLATSNQTFIVNKLTQTVTLTNPGNSYVTGNTFSLSATSSAGLTPFTYSVVSGPATVSGSTVTVTGAGSVVLQASQAGNASYNSGSGQQTITTGKASQTVTFPAIASKVVGDADFAPPATASSGLAMTYSIVSGPATIVNNKVHLTGSNGTVVVQATQAGNANWNAAATSVQQSFNVVNSLTVTPTSSGNNAPGFSIAFVPGVTIQSVPSLAVYDATAGVTIGTFYPNASNPTQWQGVGFGVNYTANTSAWTDPRGLAFNGTHTYQFTISAWSPTTGQWRNYGPATADATIAGGPTGSMTVTPGTGGTASFTIGINNNNYGSGITSYAVVDRTSGQTWSTGTGTLMGSQSFTWTDPRVPIPEGTHQYAISAWGLAAGKQYSYTADTSYLESPLTLTAVPSNYVAPPAQPKFTVAVSNLMTYSGRGDAQGITYIRVDTPGYSWYMSNGWGTTTWPAPNYSAASFNQQFADPRGSLGVGSYTYTVTVYRVTYYNNAYWVDGHWEDEHDNPDNPDEVTGSHWEDGHWENDYWSQNDWDQFAQKSITIYVANPTAQSVTFANPGTHLVGDAFALSATASAGLPVTFSVVSGPASVAGGIATVNSSGTVILRASQTGGYNPATGIIYSAASADQSFVVNPLPAPTITFANLAKNYGDAPFALTSSSNSGGTPTYSIASQSPAGTISLSGGTVTILSGGTATLHVTYPATQSYSQGGADATLTVAKLNQTISFGSLPSRSYGAAPFAVSASASSGLAVSYTVASGPATISGSTVTLTGVGTVTITAAQAGNASYNAATSVSQGFTTNAAGQTVSFPAITNKVVGDADFSPGATATSGLAVTYSIVSGPATIVNNKIHLTGAPGTVVVQAAQAGNANWNAAATSPQQSFNVVNAVTVTTTSSGNNAPGFSIAFAPGVTIQSVPSLTVSDATAGMTIGTFYPNANSNPTAWGSLAYSVNYTSNTSAWTDPRGLTFNGTHTYQFSINAWSPTTGVWRNYGPATADATITGGPTGSMTVTPGTGGTASFTIGINNNNYGSGITSYAVVDRTSGQTWNYGTGTVMGSQSFNWSDPRVPIPDGTHQFTIFAWGLAGGKQYSYSADTSYAESPLALTAVPSDHLITPAQPRFTVAVSNLMTYSGRGDAQGITYIRVDTPGYSWYMSNGWGTTTWAAPNYSAASFNQQFADPRGSLGVGSYTYTVTVYRVTYYNNAYWVDGHWEDEHDNPDNPDEVTGSHWEDGHWENDYWSQNDWDQFAQKSITIYVANPTAQTIAFTNPGAHYVGDVFNPGATASSGLAVGYSVVSGPASVSGSNVTITSAGTVMLRASQAGGFNAANGNTYSAAANVDQSFTATTLPAPTIAFANLSKTFGDAPFTLASTSNSGSTPVYSIVTQGPAGTISLSGSTVTVLGAGTATLRVAYPGTSSYSAGTADATLTVAKLGQAISFPAPANHVSSDSPFSASATATSGLAVTFSVASGPATISGSTVTLTGAGTVTIAASQAGNATYSAATNVNQSFTVTPPPPVISSAASASGTSGVAFSYTITATNSPTSYSVTGPLPAGLSLNSSSGLISGTPTQTGTFGVTIGATNGTGTNGSSLTITISPPTAPSITSQPQTQTTFVGSSPSFTVGVAGTAPFTYQWSKNGVSISGATSATYTIASAQLGDAGNYSVVVTNAAGSSTSSTATLTVNAHPPGWSTLAGLAGVSGGQNGTGSSARFWAPEGVAVDAAGNVYVADLVFCSIRKVAPDGTVSTLAGGGGVGSADGTGSAAHFNYPYGVAVDNTGNVYVADSSNHTIRKITSAGVVSTLAGLAGNAGSADGTGSAARFNYPYDVAVDNAGNVYVTDTNNSTIRKITPAGVVSTVAGLAGSSAFNVNGTGPAARFSSPRYLTLDLAGNIYVTDSGCLIRKVTSGGIVTTCAGTFTGDVDGPVATAQFRALQGLGLDAAGNIYVADSNSHTIRLITTGGMVSTLAGLAGNSGSADGAGVVARFTNPTGLAVDGTGNVYVGDTSNNTIRLGTPQAPVVNSAATSSGMTGTAINYAITTTGVPSSYSVTGALPAGVSLNPSTGIISGTPTQAGTFVVTIGATNGSGTGSSSLTINLSSAPTYAFSTLAGLPGNTGGADGTGSAARFMNPGGVAVDSAHNLYVADQSNHTIRKVTPAGVVTTLAGLAGVSGSNDGTGSGARFNFPRSVAVDGAGNVYVADQNNSTIRKITPAGVVTTLAGLAGNNGSADGTGSVARFSWPQGVTVDGAGNVYVADTYNHTIRKIAPGGAVTTLAGLAGSYGNWNGTGSAARFTSPQYLTVDNAGSLYVTDSNDQIRKVTAGGVVTTVVPYSSIFYQGVAVDGAGNIYAATSGNNTIVLVTPQGLIFPIGGLNGVAGNADGTGSAARFNYPMGVAVDNAGNVYVGDTTNRTVRLGTFTPPPALSAQVSNQTVTEGFSATFVANVTGTAPFTYQWRKNNVNISGATGATYTIANAGDADAGSYSVIVGNSSGSVTSGNATLTVQDEISGQPQNADVASGGTATFSVTARDPAVATYQWQRMAVGTTTFVNLTNNATYAGVNTSILTVHSVNPSMTGDQFRCLVSISGSANYTGTSSAATLTDPSGISTVDLNWDVLHFDPDHVGIYPASIKTTPEKYTVGDVLQIRSAASTTTPGGLTKHVVCIKRPTVPGYGTYPQENEGWNYDFSNGGSAGWPGPFSIVSDPHDLGQQTFVWINTGQTKTQHSIGEELTYDDAASSPGSHADMVLDAPGDWIIKAFTADANGVQWAPGGDITIHVYPPSLKSFVTAYPLGQTSADGPNSKFVGVFYNAGQIHRSSLEYGTDPARIPADAQLAASIWKRVFQPIPPSFLFPNHADTTDLIRQTPWQSYWSAHQVYPILPDGKGGTKFNHYMWADGGDVDRDTKRTDFAKQVATRLMDVGVDFAILDHTNLVVSTPVSSDPVLETGRLVRDGFAQAATPAGARVKIVFMLGMVGKETGWAWSGWPWQDAAPSQTETGKTRLISKIQAIWDDFADESKATNVGVSFKGFGNKPLLLFYTGGHNGPSFNSDTPSEAPATSTGELNPYYLNQLKIKTSSSDPGTLVSTLFTIKYIGAYMRNNPFYTGGNTSVINTGHWSYVEGNPAPATAVLGGGGYESFTAVPKYGTEPLGAGENQYHDRFGRAWDIKAWPLHPAAGEGSFPSKDPDNYNLGVPLSKNGMIYNDALNRGLVTFNPRVLLTNWLEFGSEPDETTPELSWTVGDNNKFGTFYSDIFKAAVHRFKGLTDQSPVTSVNSSATAGVPWSPTVTGGSGTGNVQYYVVGQTTFDATNTAGTQVVASGVSNSLNWTPPVNAAGTTFKFFVRRLGDGTYNDSKVAGAYTLTVAASGPSVSTQPTTQTATVGGTVIMSISASGSGLTYQWRKNGANLANGGSVSGAASATLTLANLSMSDTGGYDVLVATGGVTAASSTAVLTMNATGPGFGLTSATTKNGTVGSAFSYQILATTPPTVYDLTGTLPTNLSFDSSSGIISGTPGQTGTFPVTIRAANGNGSAQATLTLVIASAALTSQTINFPSIPDHTYNDPSITLNATASSGLSVSYAVSSGPALIVSGNTVTITGAGSVTITASQAGNATYAAAPSFSRSFTVAKANQTINFPGIAAHTYNDPSFTLSATATSGLGVSYSVSSGPAVVIGNSVTLTGAGTVTIVAAQAGNANYNAATNASQLITVAKAGQTITFQPVSNHVSTDGPFALSATASSGLPVSYSASGPANVSGNMVTLNGATGNVTITAAQTGDANYAAATPVPQTFTVNAPPAASRLTNLSVRAMAGTGGNTLILGFVIGGSGTKQILLRAVGPTLSTFGVTDTLADPQLFLFNSSGSLITQNDDWNSSLTDTFTVAGAFLLPVGSKDAALLQPLASGGYTPQAVGANSTTGVVLFEAYDADSVPQDAHFINLSARALVDTGSNTLIAGFNITGNASKRLFIRAVGPTLGSFGVSGTLADPKLLLFNSSNSLITQNDDWGTTTLNNSLFVSAGAFALSVGSKDAALDVTLAPGTYTVQVVSADSSTGIALVEIYEVP